MTSPKSPARLPVTCIALIGALAVGRAQESPARSEAPANWPAVAAYYRDQIRQAGIVGSSLVMVGGGQIIAEESRREVYDGILRRASLEEMWTPQIRAADGEGGSGDDVQAALSFLVERHHGVELVGHSGNQNGFLSHLYLHRPSGAGYIVGFNTEATSDAARQRELTRQVDDRVRDRSFAASSRRPDRRTDT